MNGTGTRAAGCEPIGRLLQSYAEGRLPEDDQQLVRQHLSRCAGCREACIAAGDPTALFLELRGAPLPDAQWTGFMRDLRQRLARPARLAEDRQPADRRLSGWGDLLRYPRLAYVAAPLAMVLVLGVTIFVLRPSGPDRIARVTPPDAIRSPYARVPGRRQTRPAPDATHHLQHQLALPTTALKAVEPPALEEVASPGARVYRFHIEGSEDETPIYLVVDESIDF